MTATTITITGTYLNPDNTPDTGTVTFTPINPRELSSDSQIVEQNPEVGKVVAGVLKNSAGTGAMILVTNTGGYHVTESLDGASVQPTYDIRGDIDVNLNSITYGQTVSASGLGVQTTTTVTGTSYTLTQADFNGDNILSFTSAGSGGLIPVTIPLDVSSQTLNPADGQHVTLVQDGTGQIVVGGPSAGTYGGTSGGVTVSSPTNVWVTVSQYGQLRICRRAANDYRVEPAGTGFDAREEILTDAASVTPVATGHNGGYLATLSQAVTFQNPSGTTAEFQQYLLRVKSTTARAITWGSAYRFGVDVAQPTTTTGSSLTDYWGFQYNAVDSKWDLIGKATGF